MTHRSTGLMWTKKDSYADLGKCLNWNDAKDYVSKLRTGGYTDWRMPTIEELKTIYDEQFKVENRFNKIYPLHYSPVFASRGALWYWSSETFDSSYARFIGFYVGTVGIDSRTACTDAGIRAVRP